MDTSWIPEHNFKMAVKILDINKASANDSDVEDALNVLNEIVADTQNGSDYLVLASKALALACAAYAGPCSVSGLELRDCINDLKYEFCHWE